MRIILKKCLAIILALFINIPVMPMVFAQVPEGRNISIFRVDGNDVNLVREPGGRAINPRAGHRLAEGNILSTGRDTQVYLLIDQASIFKMDESTSVLLGSARHLVSMTVQSGSALVEVTEQSPSHSMETRVGNVGLVVRGTIYIVSRLDSDAAIITMLSGSGEVAMPGEDGAMHHIYLPAGLMMWVYDVYEDAHAAVEDTYRISAIDVNELNLFELTEIINRQEYLIDIGVATAEMIEEAREIVEELRGDQIGEQVSLDNADDEVVWIFLPEDEPSDNDCPICVREEEIIII